jgi:hypothetical protein
MLNLVSWNLTEVDQWNNCQPCSQNSHQDRREALARSTQDETRSESLALEPFEVLIVIHEQNPVARRDTQNRQEADQRPERDDSIAGIRCQLATDQGSRQEQIGKQCKPPTSE